MTHCLTMGLLIRHATSLGGGGETDDIALEYPGRYMWPTHACSNRQLGWQYLPPSLDTIAVGASGSEDR